MNFEIVSNEKSIAEMKLTIDKDAFEKGIAAAYNKNKGKFNIAGFRKGKAPRAIIENRYGKSVFYEEALEEAFPEEYNKAIEEAGLKTVAQPTLKSVDKIDEDGVVCIVEIPLEPTFTLGEYKGIKVGSLEYTPTDADIADELKKMQDKNARMLDITEEAAIMGDTLKIDFEGFDEGVPFDGGKAEGYDLTLGSGAFIPGFEDALVGVKAEDEVDVNVSFPEDYHVDTLAGKPVVFKVKVHEIKRKEVSPIDDDFALDLGFDDLAALKADTADKIKKQKEAELKTYAEQQIMAELVAKTDMDIAEVEIAEEAHHVREDYENRLKQYGFEAEDYYNYVLSESENKDPEQFEAGYRAQAESQIKARYITRAIIDAEGIAPSDEELEAEYQKFADAYKQSIEEFKEQYLKMDAVKSYILSSLLQNKFYDFLLANADTTPIETAEDDDIEVVEAEEVKTEE